MAFALLGGAPLALAYKAANTLDSMVGYRNERYGDFGYASAIAVVIPGVAIALSVIAVTLAGDGAARRLGIIER